MDSVDRQRAELRRRHIALMDAIQHEKLPKDLGVTTDDTRTLVEDCYSLDVSGARKAFERGPDPRGWSKLHKLDPWELSKPPWRETYRLEARGPIYSNRPFVSPVDLEAWHLDYERHLIEIQLPNRDSVAVRWDEQPWSFGGIRRWWLCLGCDRRCSKLYSLPRWSGGLNCRCCRRLAYSIENRSKVNRKIDRYWRQAIRHGIPCDTLSSIFDRPCGQHMTTYERGLYQLQELEHKMVMAIWGLKRVRS